MDHKMKHGTNFTLYLYQIRWFVITTFAADAPKQLEAVKITASGSHSIRLQIL